MCAPHLAELALGGNGGAIGHAPDGLEKVYKSERLQPLPLVHLRTESAQKWVTPTASTKQVLLAQWGGRGGLEGKYQSIIVSLASLRTRLKVMNNRGIFK
eukprot:4498584-Pyramimonas_sp.AAC.1